MDIPEEVVKGYRLKIESLATRSGLALPYPSCVALIFAGLWHDQASTEALRILMKERPDEVPLEVAPAGCRVIDRAFRQARRERRETAPPAHAVQAVLLATDEGLAYLRPFLGDRRRWSWDNVDVRARKIDRRFAHVELKTPEGRYEMTVGPPACANMLAISQWVNGSP